MVVRNWLLITCSVKSKYLTAAGKLTPKNKAAQHSSRTEACILALAELNGGGKRMNWKPKASSSFFLYRICKKQLVHRKWHYKSNFYFSSAMSMRDLWTRLLLCIRLHCALHGTIGCYIHYTFSVSSSVLLNVLVIANEFNFGGFSRGNPLKEVRLNVVLGPGQSWNDIEYIISLPPLTLSGTLCVLLHTTMLVR